MRDFEKPFLMAFLCILIIIFVGVLGYEYIEGWNFIDSLYMITITLTTIGFGETHELSSYGRIFTIFIIIVGVGTEAYVLKGVAILIVEGGLKKMLSKQKIQRKIDEIKEHLIVCGYGKVGKVIVSELSHENLPFVVIDNDPEVCLELEEKSYLFIKGNATDDEILKKAGISKAKGLLAALPSDADNLYVVLSSRELNNRLSITSRCKEEFSESKLYRAGADKVISPYYIGAVRMAQSITKPNVSSYLDLINENKQLHLNMEEIPIPQGSALHNIPLRDSQIRDKLGIIVISIKKIGNKMILNPGPGELIQEGDHLIVLGEIDQIKALHVMTKEQTKEGLNKIIEKVKTKDACRYIQMP